MRRSTLTALGETEMEVLRHVWDLGRASVGDVHERILAERQVAYTTIMTVMKNLADKGYLGFEKEGNAYVYSAAQQPEEVRGSLLSALLSKVFQGSPEALVQTLVRHEALTEADRDALRRIIDEMEDDDDDNS